mmetsp:Transcript_40696/g.90476  ORF Transcript_40696/g.90476 Transcript_40696/m.90476 type:complete len:230 (+) Transcript_40696:145-834(+)
MRSSSSSCSKQHRSSSTPTNAINTRWQGAQRSLNYRHETLVSASVHEPRRTRNLAARAINIDRRHHMDLAWQRQQEREQRCTEATPSPGHVLEVESLAHLETLLEKAGSCLVIVFFYSKTCGVCKQARERFEQLCVEAKKQKARVVFLQHNVLDEYDHPSDVSRWHKVRAVPCFLFVDDGAVVHRLSLRDVRRLTGPTALIQGAMAEDMRKLKDTIQEIVFQRAPSARA